MFEAVSETFTDIRDSIGDTGFYIFLALAAAFGLYNLSKGKNTAGELTPVTTVSSYPDAVTNANVIIDTLQNSIDYSEAQIIEEIQGLETGINTQFEGVGKQFEATNNYIHNGLEQATQIYDKVEGLGNQIDGLGNQIYEIGKDIDLNTNISAMTYYETMLHQGRDGYIAYNPGQALQALEYAGFDTSNEKATHSDGRFTDTPGSVGGGHTTFIGDNSELHHKPNRKV